MVIGVRPPSVCGRSSGPQATAGKHKNSDNRNIAIFFINDLLPLFFIFSEDDQSDEHYYRNRNKQ